MFLVLSVSRSLADLIPIALNVPKRSSLYRRFLTMVLRQVSPSALGVGVPSVPVVPPLPVRVDALVVSVPANEISVGSLTLVLSLTR